MAIPPLGIIAIISASVFGPEYLILRGKEKALGILADAIMCGFIGMGILTYMQLPVTYAAVNLVSEFTPHAYNLILWPLAALLLLRPRFGPVMMLPVLILVYGLDEFFWNGFALLAFGWMKDAFNVSTGILWYFSLPYWHVFIAVMAVFVIVGYLIVRPQIKLRKNPALFTMLGFGVVWALIGLPNGAVTLLSLAWELMWQAVYWFFVMTTFFPRKKA